MHTRARAHTHRWASRCCRGSSTCTPRGKNSEEFSIHLYIYVCYTWKVLLHMESSQCSGFTWIWILMCLCVCLCVCACACACVCVCVCVLCMCKCVCALYMARTHTCTCTCLHIHMCVNILIYRYKALHIVEHVHAKTQNKEPRKFSL